MDEALRSKVGMKDDGKRLTATYTPGLIRRGINKLRGKQTFSNDIATDMYNVQQGIATGSTTDPRTQDAFRKAQFARSLANTNKKK